MRVVIISTYPPIECGIGTYTQFLCEELKKTDNEIIIVSQYGAKGDNVFPAYSPDDPNPAKTIFHFADTNPARLKFFVYILPEGIVRL